MIWWILAGAVLAGTAVLGVLGARALVAARGLNREITVSGARIGANRPGRGEGEPSAAYDQAEKGSSRSS